MAFIEIEITGMKEYQASCQSLADATPEELDLAATISQQAETMMTISKDVYCPVIYGTLRSSGKVDPANISADTVEVTLGYGGAARRYAWRVHQNPRTGHTEGRSPSGKRYTRWSKVGQWKFLETPVVQRRQIYFDAIAKTMAGQIHQRFKH